MVGSEAISTKVTPIWILGHQRGFNYAGYTSLMEKIKAPRNPPDQDVLSHRGRDDRSLLAKIPYGVG